MTRLYYTTTVAESALILASGWWVWLANGATEAPAARACFEKVRA